MDTSDALQQSKLPMLNTLLQVPIESMHAISSGYNMLLYTDVQTCLLHTC
jgi:hypothetical protein